MSELKKLKEDVEVIREQTGFNEKDESAWSRGFGAILQSLTISEQGTICDKFFNRALTWFPEAVAEANWTENQLNDYISKCVGGPEVFKRIMETGIPIERTKKSAQLTPPAPVSEKWRGEEYP